MTASLLSPRFALAPVHPLRVRSLRDDRVQGAQSQDRQARGPVLHQLGQGKQEVYGEDLGGESLSRLGSVTSRRPSHGAHDFTCRARHRSLMQHGSTRPQDSSGSPYRQRQQIQKHRECWPIHLLEAVCTGVQARPSRSAIPTVTVPTGLGGAKCQNKGGTGPDSSEGAPCEVRALKLPRAPCPITSRHFRFVFLEDADATEGHDTMNAHCRAHPTPIALLVPTRCPAPTVLRRRVQRGSTRAVMRAQGVIMRGGTLFKLIAAANGPLDVASTPPLRTKASL